jgi:glycosyltransferase involved in cell wall biosynthesis
MISFTNIQLVELRGDGVRVRRSSGLLEINAPLVAEQIKHRQLSNRQAAEEVADRVMSAADALIAVSDQVARFLVERTGRRNCVHVIPNGVNTDRFSGGVSPTLTEASAIFTVGFTGTMKPWHGLEILTQAFMILQREDPTVGLLVVGDGPERARMKVI